ncbi:hypothetical protein Tco_0638574 [Tanacetum coccineum]
MPSEAVEQGMDDHVPDEIDGVKCEQLPNYVVNKGNLKVLVCKQVANHGGDELVDKGRQLKRKTLASSNVLTHDCYRLRDLDRGIRSVLIMVVMDPCIYACSDSLLLTPLCCDDIHEVTPRVSALAGCDRLVSEPMVIEKIDLRSGYLQLRESMKKIFQRLPLGRALKGKSCENALILSLPDGSKEFVVYCDVSNQGLSCVLMQRGKVENAAAEMLRGLDQLMERKEGGGMYLSWVPLISDVRTLMMDEAHASRYLVHSGADKTYYDLRDMDGGHVWRRILLPMLPRSSSGYDTNWVIVDSLTKADIGESSLIRPELVQETTDKVVLIKEKLKAARDRQRSYADNRRKPLEFEVGDQVLLKVSSWKDVYWTDANLHVHLEEIKVDKTLRFVEEPVEIIDREVKSLKRSRIPIVKSIGTRSEIDIR